MREKENLTLLGNQQTEYRMDYDPSVLEAFQNKHPENDYFVKFNCPEFTSLCPITGQPDFSAILRLPSLNTRSSFRSLFRFLVPSGKIQTEIPFFTFSIPSRIVFRPALISFLSRNKQLTFFIQLLKRGILSISFFATKPTKPGTVV